jgi:hypothetical protein
MELNGQLAIGLLYLGIRGVPVYTQNLIIIALVAVCQNISFVTQRGSGPVETLPFAVWE